MTYSTYNSLDRLVQLDSSRSGFRAWFPTFP